ncbi:MAG TPA: hypothetical protein VLA01_01575 [Nitrosopumilaceae archaeon]|nr:hypothetical protein [Nitrosopumilaceae archaeon]
MQESDPLPWGTQDRFQAHFIVRKDSGNNALDYTARTILSTEGHFGSKKIKNVTWNGGKLAKILNDDSALKELILKQSVKDATIFVDPTENVVRIYGKWKNDFEFGITKELFEIYDKIAGHVKSL